MEGNMGASCELEIHGSKSNSDAVFLPFKAKNISY